MVKVIGVSAGQPPQDPGGRALNQPRPHPSVILRVGVM